MGIPYAYLKTLNKQKTRSKITTIAHLINNNRDNQEIIIIQAGLIEDLLERFSVTKDGQL